MSASAREDREPIRCSNAECPSRHGSHGARIVVERGLKTGWYYKKVGKYEMVSVLPIKIPCESCGQHWLNPGLAFMDGFTEVIDGAAERLRERRPCRPASSLAHPRCASWL